MDDQTKNRLINRVHRIEGQARGIENMLREDRSYKEIITQLKAVSSASSQITTEILRELLNKERLDTEDKAYILKSMKKD